MNRIVTQKSNKVKFIAFLFLFLVLFFGNPLDAFAAGGGGGSFVESNFGVTDAKNLQEQASGAYRGGKMIYSSSFDLGHFHFGETEKIIEYRLFYEKNHSGNYSKLEFFKWLLEETKLELDADVVAYADCIIFNDAYDGDPYYCTGWLYLFCDSDRYLEYAENIAGIGNEYIPLFYEEGATEGSMFITFPGQYFYYPVSNMIRDDEPDWYQTQIYTSGEDYKNNDAISVNSALRIIDYYTHASQGKGKIHDVDDFSGIWGTKDLRVFNYTMPGKYAWVMSFCCSSMVLNAENSIGQSYPYNYPIDKGYINQVFTELTTEGNPNYIESLMAYINIKNEEGTGLLPATASGGPYRGMKESSQTLGIDTIFSGVVSNGAAARVGLQKDRILNCGVLLDGTKTMENLYNKIKSLSSNDKTFKFNAENILQLYQECMVTQNIPANFVNVNGIPVALRYVWSASSSILMADGDINFPRDTANLTYSVSEKLTGDVWTTSKTSLNNSNYTASFSDFGYQRYNNLDDLEKIKSIIVVLQTYPELFPAMVEKDRTVAKYVNYAKGKDALVKLNELAVKDHYKWQLCILAVGDCLYEHSLASNTPSNGWNTIYAFLRNGEQNYSTLSVGINICQTTAFIPRVSDLVMSNSYNYNPSTYAFENVSEEVQYNPTARNVIDWIHGSVFDNQYVGGSGSLPSLEKGPYTTILDSSSNWQQFDIKSKASVGSTIYGGLSSGKNNNLKLDAESNLGKSFDENPENVHFNTSVYVGRIPEANPEQKLYVGDIQVLAKSSYNQFELKNDGTIDEFNASEDLDAGARANIAMYSADGKANSILGGYFSGFYTDFNTQVLFKIYNGSTRNYYAQNILQVKATPTAILKASGIGIGGYNYSDYPEFGPNALNYHSISGSKSGVSSSTEVAPGDVVQFELDYRIPNSTTLQVISELNMTTTTLLETGAWYQDYGQILTADVDYWIVPSYTNDAVSKFTEVNKNTNNDWVKMRINVPLMDNIYFTHANVCGGVSMDSGDARVTEVGGLEVGYSPQGGTTYEFEVNLSPGPGTTHYNNTDIYVTCNWRYWSKGRTSGDVSNLKNNYNFINYYNGFKLKSGKLYANDVKGNGNSRDMYLKDKRPDLTVSPNSDILNAAKDKSLRLQVPRNGCNDYTKDWEIIIVKFVNIPEKDNAVIDLVLEKGGTTYGNVSRYQGNQHEAQVIPSELSSANLYAVIKRLAPRDITTWEETSYKTGKAECHFQITVDDGKSMREVPGSLFTGSIGGYRGIALADFDKTTECIIYKTIISGPFSYLSATANYRNKDCCYDREDINMGNNYWSEIWESSKNPNFVMDIVDGQANVQQSRTYHYCGSKPACNLEDTEVTPYLIVEVAQDNPNAKDTYNTRFHVDMSGRNPIKASGHGSYLGSGNVSVTFSGGDTSSKQFYIEWAPMIISRGTNSSRNKTYVMKPYINYGSVRDITSETYILDNIKEWRWTANITCNYIEDCPIDDCCVFAYRKVREAKSFKGAGYTYYWDVVFRWSQNTHDQYAYYNQFVPHYWCIQCGSKTIKDSEGNTIAWIPGPGHMHCPCYCRCINGGPALNNGQNWWRNGGGYGYRGLGEGRYYETWNLAIMVDSSAHGERSIGTTYIYDGEDFIWWYETWYSTNRGNQPDAPYYPQVQPYDTKQGGTGHCTCNYLHRKPDARDITGPKYVDISCSGTQDYDYFYDEIGPHAGGGWLNKHFYWYPVPDRIFVEDNQIVCQVIKLYICVYDFHGHKYDTTNDYLGGQLPPGYNWYKNGMTQSYCDSKTGTIIICPSRTYIGSAMATEGLDASSGGLNENDSGIIPDGDVWVQ